MLLSVPERQDQIDFFFSFIILSRKFLWNIKLRKSSIKVKVTENITKNLKIREVGQSLWVVLYSNYRYIKMYLVALIEYICLIGKS